MLRKRTVIVPDDAMNVFEDRMSAQDKTEG